MPVTSVYIRSCSIRAITWFIKQDAQSSDYELWDQDGLAWSLDSISHCDLFISQVSLHLNFAPKRKKYVLITSKHPLELNVI